MKHLFPAIQSVAWFVLPAGVLNPAPVGHVADFAGYFPAAQSILQTGTAGLYSLAVSARALNPRHADQFPDHPFAWHLLAAEDQTVAAGYVIAAAVISVPVRYFVF